MWEIVSDVGLGHRLPTPNVWDSGEREEDEEEKI